MTYIPHDWVMFDGNTVCEVCDITGEMFEHVQLHTAMPTCTFGADRWYQAQPDIVSQDVIGRAIGLYGTEDEYREWVTHNRDNEPG